MILRLKRDYQTKKATFGKLYVNARLECFTLENIKRRWKVWGKTRIPAGEYEIKLRTVGGFHKRYSRRFNFHKGMLHLKKVRGFKYILIHIGNTSEDTAGCILVGNYRGDGAIWDSTKAYQRLYEKVLKAIELGEKVFILIEDE